jgi:hypothetical protein
MDASNIIKSVEELFSNPSKWTKGEFARDEDNNPCDAGSAVACCFCLQGAIDLVSEMDFFGDGDCDEEAYPEAAQAAAAIADVIRERYPERITINPEHPYGVIATFNDATATTVEDVLTVLRAAQEKV